MKRFLTTAIMLIMILTCITRTNAQNSKQETGVQKNMEKIIKKAKKEAKKLEGKDWQPLTTLPIVEQLKNVYTKTQEDDIDGYPRYIMRTCQTKAKDIATARIELETLAKIGMAKEMNTMFISLVLDAVADYKISQKEATSIISTIENANRVEGLKLGNITKEFEIFRYTGQNNENVEVMVIFAYDVKTALSIQREIIINELRKNLEINMVQLEQMMSTDNLIEMFI